MDYPELFAIPQLDQFTIYALHKEYLLYQAFAVPYDSGSGDDSGASKP